MDYGLRKRGGVVKQRLPEEKGSEGRARMRPQRGPGRAERRPQAGRQARRPPRRKVNRPARRGHLGHPGLTRPPRRASRNRARPRGQRPRRAPRPPREPGSAGTSPRPHNPRPTRPRTRSTAGEPRPPPPPAPLPRGVGSSRGGHLLVLLVAGRRSRWARAGHGGVQSCGRPRCCSFGHWRAKWRRHQSARPPLPSRRTPVRPGRPCCRLPRQPRHTTTGPAAAAAARGLELGSRGRRRSLEPKAGRRRRGPAGARAGSPGGGRGLREGGPCEGARPGGAGALGRAEGLGPPAGQEELRSGRARDPSAPGPAGQRSSLLGDGRLSAEHTTAATRRWPSWETTGHPLGAHPPPGLEHGLLTAFSRGEPGLLCWSRLPGTAPAPLYSPQEPFPAPGNNARGARGYDAVPGIAPHGCSPLLSHCHWAQRTSHAPLLLLQPQGRRHTGTPAGWLSHGCSGSSSPSNQVSCLLQTSCQRLSKCLSSFFTSSSHHPQTPPIRAQHVSGQEKQWPSKLS